jgi:hypothetical protein
MSRYIDEHARSFGVEPICATLEIAPSSYYAARSRPLSARAIADEQLKPKIAAVHESNFAVYGARKIWHVMRREGTEIGRDRVARLMTGLGLSGATRERTIRTTRAADQSARPADLVERTFAAPAPNRLWVADLTYVWMIAGFAYTAFVIDVFSRRIVGWRTAASLRTDIALDALEMAIYSRGHDLAGLVHHSDRGVQYLATDAPNAWPKRVSSTPWAPRATHTTTPSPRPSTGSTRPSSSAAGNAGTRSKSSNWPPLNGCPGGTSAAFIPPAETSLQPSSRRHTIAN